MLHLNKVEGPVEAAAQLRNVHREGELLIQQIEHLVVVPSGVQKVVAGSYVPGRNFGLEEFDNMRIMHFYLE